MRPMVPDFATPDTAAPGATVDVPEKPTLDGLEEKWVARWAEQDTYAFDRAAALDPATPRGQIWSIDTPPPTASGSLHVGHVFSYTHTDFIARYQRMPGKHQQPISRRNFVELCMRLTAEDEAEFEKLWRRVGLSVDWSDVYRTISESSRATAQRMFLHNLARGEAYAQEAPTLWD